MRANRGFYNIAWKFGMTFRDEPYFELKYLIIAVLFFAILYYFAKPLDFFDKVLITIYSVIWPASMPSLIIFIFLVVLIRAIIYIKNKLELWIIIKFRS